MPIIVNPVTIEAPTLAYDRLAIRGAIEANIVNGALAEDSTLALVGCWYRKPADGVFDLCGVTGANEKSASIRGQYDIIKQVADACLAYVGVTGDARVVLHFNWRPVAGDLTGMVNLMVTPAGGEQIQRLSSDTNELQATDPAFDTAYKAVIAALAVWLKAHDW